MSAKDRIIQGNGFETVKARNDAIAVVGKLTDALTRFKEQTDQLKTEVALIEDERDHAIYLLTKVYLAEIASSNDQEHWFEKVNSFLFNRGLLPGEPEHTEALAALFNQIEQSEKE